MPVGESQRQKVKPLFLGIAGGVRVELEAAGQSISDVCIL